MSFMQVSIEEEPESGAFAEQSRELSKSSLEEDDPGPS
jgi:hypothetical protein